MDDAKATIARRLRTQGDACASIGSSLYAGLLELAARDVEVGGVVWEALRGHEHDPGPSVLALRLLGTVHRMVLEGRLSDLGAHYPSAGGDASGGAEAAWPAFVTAVAGHLDEVRAGLERGVQTNEAARATALVGGFLTVARDTGMPLRVLEVGASAGLLLRWDHFGYRAGERFWGDPESPLQLGDPYEEGAPPFDVAARVVERRGCDPNPIDPTSDDGRLTLMSYAWPDMLHRFDDLRCALDVARAVPARVDRAEAAVWVTEQLAAPVPGVATVVYHSVVMQYLTDDGRARFRAALDDAAARATPDAPLAWLRFEPARRLFEVRLTIWPDGTERHLADSGPHGRPVRWFA